MTRRAAAAALLTLGLLAQACGSTGGGASSTTSVVVSPATGPTTGSVAAEGSLATLVRSGGLAGRRFQVVVRPDGSFEGGSGKPGRGHLGGAALEELRSLVAAFAAAAPDPSYGTAAPDGFTLSVTAGGVSTSVLGEGNPPSPVSELVGFLAGLERQLPR